MMAAIAKESVLTKLPIIVILGATGTGKSKLAIQVAKQFNGEIISADAMQLYRGLDIVTNKVTPVEAQDIPHHMMDYLDPLQPTKVTDFRDKALPILEDLLQRNKLPIIAGGTCYYVESLLWKLLMNSPAAEMDQPPCKKLKTEDSLVGEVRGVLREVMKGEGDVSCGEVLDSVSEEVKRKLHVMLRKVDPERAEELHPNNVRKVCRSLQVYESSGKKHSEQLKEQRAQGGNHLGGPLRYPNSLILWVTCEKEVLNKRLDSRVDDMIQQGLIQELLDFHKQYNLQRIQEGGETKPPAYTLGIFQSIGFKEFHDYLMLSDQEREEAEGKLLFNKGVELMKIATRQYAKRQIKWIKKRFLGRESSQAPPVFCVDGSDVSLWDGNVKDRAFSIVQSFVDASPCPIQPEPVVDNKKRDHTILKCEECDRLFTGSVQFEAHMKSEKHKRRLRKLVRQREESNMTSTEDNFEESKRVSDVT